MGQPGGKRPSSRLDVGRAVAVVIFVALIAVNAGHLWNKLGDGSLSPVDGLISLLTLTFYALLTVAYLRRSRSQATDRTWSSWLAAFLGTGAPFLLPLMAPGRRDPGVLTSVAAVVLLSGLAFMLWALSYLGTNISVVPQARQVVTTGPYSWVRHPLYAAELWSALGVSLALEGLQPWALLLGSAVLQFIRARREERLLRQELPGYGAYMDQTPMLLPFPLLFVRGAKAGSSARLRGS